ncbi:MAG: peptide deformylase [Actinomycetota bacterium]|nr:peptide deformylase [Actinomycetota bacterium]
MAVRPVITYPHALLKQVAPPAERINKAIKDLAGDLIDTMKAHERCVGLAAPQIGESQRVIAVNVSGHPKAVASHGLLVIVNPKITASSGSEVGREGCLSLPAITANVRRALRITFEGLWLDGSPFRSLAWGFEARALQHEIDHLDGILILDKVASPSEIFPRR